MKIEDLEARQRLLNDVLSEVPGDAAGITTKGMAIAAFRRARFARRVRRYGAITAIVATTLAAISGFRSATESRTAGAPAHGSPKLDELPKLTDEDLLASFPPDSCVLAEVDGRQILVFSDPQMSEKFLHGAAR